MANEEFRVYALGEDGLASIAEAVSDKSGSGGDDGGSGMEARMAKIEATVEHIQSDIDDIKTDMRGIRNDIRNDFKLVIGAIAGSFVILAGAGAIAYMNLNDKFFGINEKLTTIIDKLQ